MAQLNRQDYTNHFRNQYQSASYYRPGREWSDYEPAYNYGFDQYAQRSGQRFEDIENDLERGWDTTKANSKLAWTEAKEAVRDGWHRLERAMPGDADRDGR